MKSEKIGDANDQANLDKFYQEHLFPIVGEINSSTVEFYKKSNKGLIWFYWKLTKENANTIIKKKMGLMKEVALDPQIKNNYRIGWVNIDNRDFSDIETGVVVYKEAVDKHYYQYRSTITLENIKKYLKKIDEGKVDPTFRSDEDPEGGAKQKGREVKMVTGNLYTRMISKEKKKDVMLKIFAPACEECKILAP